MAQQHEHTVRLTVDFPVEQHTYIKMMAAKEGISMRKFIIEHLPSPSSGSSSKNKKKKDKNTKFNKLLDEIMTEYADELMSLSKR